MGRSTKTIDWEKIERAYRLNFTTDMQNAADNGVSRSALVRRAKKEGWTKDLSEQVRLETKARVRANIVEDATKTLHATLHETFQKDSTAVQLEATSNALLIAEHEKGGTKGREVMSSILDRIDEQIRSAPTIDELLELLKVESPELGSAIARVTSLPSLADTAKKAIEGFSRSVDIERKARNMDAKDEAGGKEVDQAILDAILADKAESCAA
jgi:hypothetical protein